MNRRYIIMQDDDFHWYLVPLEDKLIFAELFRCNYDEIPKESFELMEKRRIDGPHVLTFTNPVIV